MDNYQALAYATLALNDLGYSREQVGLLRGKMLRMMDENTEEEAEKRAADYLAE
jgi:hypothetical protein